MRALLISLVLLALPAFGSTAPPGGAATEKLMKRADKLTGKGNGLLFYIPPRGDLPGQVGQLVNSLQATQSQHTSLVIYSPDAQRATRATTLAFAMIKPNWLRGCTIICAVGQKNESYIRPVVEATGAKLYVEPLP
jgi:hypothetical protein